MKASLLTVLALAVSWAILSSPHAAIADPPKEAELLKRIEQLEKRVAELEKAIKEHPLGKEPATKTEKMLVGNWAITDDGKKTAAKNVLVFTDLTMKADGTCALVKAGQLHKYGTYRVTVAGSVTELSIKIKLNDPLGGYSSTVRIASVSEKELVLQFQSKEGWVKVAYTRTK